jgi:hypothetical protein
MPMSPNLKIIAGPCVIDQAVARLIKLPSGSGRIEVWKRSAGWIPAAGSITLDEFMPGACRPVSVRDRARVGMPVAEMLLIEA